MNIKSIFSQIHLYLKYHFFLLNPLFPVSLRNNVYFGFRLKGSLRDAILQPYVIQPGGMRDPGEEKEESKEFGWVGWSGGWERGGCVMKVEQHFYPQECIMGFICMGKFNGDFLNQCLSTPLWLVRRFLIFWLMSRDINAQYKSFKKKKVFRKEKVKFFETKIIFKCLPLLHPKRTIQTDLKNH